MLVEGSGPYDRSMLGFFRAIPVLLAWFVILVGLGALFSLPWLTWEIADPRGWVWFFRVVATAVFLIILKEMINRLRDLFEQPIQLSGQIAEKWSEYVGSGYMIKVGLAFNVGVPQFEQFTLRENVYAACQEGQAVDVVYSPHTKRVLRMLVFPLTT